MNLKEARNLVIKAGHKLVNSGLISRTWGNVSCRVGEASFVITPSGRNYLTLTEEEIVHVNSRDLSYDGSVEPSSEKRIHAAIYQLDPMTNFIIHTHQENASIVSALGLSSIHLPTPDPDLGCRIVCAEYALPGTKALCDNTVAAFRHSEGNAIVLEHHGALCIGGDDEEAFRVSAQLETACGAFLEKLAPAHPDYRTETLFGRSFCGSRRSRSGFVLCTDSGEIQINSGEIIPHYETECKIYNEIYRTHSEIHQIVVSRDPSVVRFSLHGTVLKTYLDDFAQMAGSSVKVTPLIPKTVSRALSHASAVLLQGVGALCCGKNEGDAEAVRQICEKNCKAYWAGLLVDGACPIKPLEAAVMRRNYLKKYAKKF